MAKFYAVAKGRKPGIYFDWYTASQQTDGYSSAVFQKFYDYEDALRYLHRYEKQQDAKAILKSQPLDAIIEIDGVQQPHSNYADTLFIAYQIKPVSASAITAHQSRIQLKNFTTDVHAAELNAVVQAVKACFAKNLKHVKVIYDYKGIEKLLTNEMPVISQIAKFYQSVMIEYIAKMNIEFEEASLRSPQSNPLRKELENYATQNPR